MNKLITLCLGIAMLTSCAFKDKPEANQINTTSSLLHSPGKTHMLYQGSDLALLDIINMPLSQYQVDLTRTVNGRIEYPILYPKFTETYCQGIGYKVGFEPQRKGISTKLVLVPFLNGSQINEKVFTVAASDHLQIGVYTDYSPVQDFIESGNLPNEILKSLQPSANCRMMCIGALVTPIRPLTRQNCYWNQPDLAPNGAIIGGHWTDLVYVTARFFEAEQIRNNFLAQLQECNAVQSNDDLKYYYSELSKPCQSQHGLGQSIMGREWYMVEQKIGYEAPQYSIDNLSDVVKAGDSQIQDPVSNRAVHQLREWSN